MGESGMDDRESPEKQNIRHNELKRSQNVQNRNLIRKKVQTEAIRIAVSDNIPSSSDTHSP